jgi:hypothetical protein
MTPSASRRLRWVRLVPWWLWLGGAVWVAAIIVIYWAGMTAP